MKVDAPIGRGPLELITAAALAAGIICLALSQGGYGGAAVGAATIVAWLFVLVAVLAGRDDDVPLRGTFLVAAVALALLAGVAALSLGWTPDQGAGFSDAVRFACYAGVFLAAGLLIGPANSRAAIAGIATGLIGVALIALGSRLLQIGPGDADLAATIPLSGGRLSYPIGYWNALGSMAAMAIPLLVWLAAASNGRARSSLSLAAFAPVILVIVMTSSRGGVLAAALGAIVSIAICERRTAAMGAFAVGVAAALPAVVAAAAGAGILDSPGTAIGSSEAAVVVCLVFGSAAAALFGPWAVERAGGLRLPGVRLRYVAGGLAAILIVAVLAVGPSRIADEFSGTSGAQPAASARTGLDLSVGGSGRAQFWSAAIDAFADEPLQGVGGGGYPSYWNEHGSLTNPVQNAHSEPLEILAELGLLGFIPFLAFVIAVGLGSAGPARRRVPEAGACLGLVAAGLIGTAIDWTWDVPATVLPVLLAAAMLATGALGPRVGSSAAARRRQVNVPAPALALIAAAGAIPAVWAGAVLFSGTSSLDASDESLEAADLNRAAGEARSAAQVLPWSADPWLQLATVEQAAGNADASRAAVRRAIELGPGDFRAWLLAANIEAGLGNDQAALAYSERARLLAPLVVSRASGELPSAQANP